MEHNNIQLYTYHAFGTAAYLTLSRAFEYLFNALCFSLRLSLAVLKAVLTGFCNFASVIEAELGSASINYNNILALRTMTRGCFAIKGREEWQAAECLN